jgi:cell pole-organizing protein PopZ
MSKVAEASEPSMQEILASIRKIISDEDLPEDGGAKPAEPEDVFAEEAGEVAAEADFAADVDEVATETTETPVEVDVSVQEDNGDRMFDPPADEDEDLLELTPDMEIELEAPTPVEHMDDDLVFDEPHPDAADAEPEPEAQPEPEAEIAAEPQPEPALAPPPPQPPTVEATPVPPPVLPSEKILSDSTGAAVGAAFGELNSLLLDRESRTVEDLIRDMLQPMLKTWLDDNLPTLVEKIVREEIERVSRGR